MTRALPLPVGLHSRPALLRWHVALLSLVLAGCATGPLVVRTEVTSFDNWSTLPAERSYVFAPTLEYQNSLEMQSYEGLVRDELAQKGFALATDAGAANLVVTLRPSITDTAVRIADPWPYPYWGRYWGGAGGFYGPGRWGWYGSPWGYGGYYDGFGPGFAATTLQIFNRRLELDIDSRTTSGKRYYEGRVESTGRNDSLPQTMPILVRALFTDFPGNNGQTRRVDVPVEPRPADRR